LKITNLGNNFLRGIITTKHFLNWNYIATKIKYGYFLLLFKSVSIDIELHLYHVSERSDYVSAHSIIQHISLSKQNHSIMKKIAIAIISLFLVVSSHAQIGINTKTPQATLDIVSENNISNTQVLSVKNTSNTEIFSLRNQGYLGLGVSNPNIRLDLRNGNNNSIIGIGTSKQTAISVQAGTLKYDIASKALFFSDNNVWNKLSSNVIKTYVIANINNSNQTFLNNTSTTIQNWQVKEDLLNTFSSSTGEFIAPRTGTYTISVIATFNNGSVLQNSYMQLELISPTATVKCQSVYYGSVSTEASVLCSGNFQLIAGQTLKAVIYHNLGINKTLKIGYCNLSILEN
jgi:hypothetical protein